jgi:hypothetical protein
MDGPEIDELAVLFDANVVTEEAVEVRIVAHLSWRFGWSGRNGVLPNIVWVALTRHQHKM